MRVKELIARTPVMVPRETSVMDARRLMLEGRMRHLLVVDDGRLAGIVTDRDIRLNLPSPATTLSVWEANYLIARLTVGEVMTKSVIVVEPDRDARAAAALLVSERIGALPVVDDGRILGIVTETDFVRAFADQGVPAAR